MGYATYDDYTDIIKRLARGRQLKHKNELEDAVWLSKKDLKNLLTSNLKDMEPARPGTIARYLLESWVQNSI